MTTLDESYRACRLLVRQSNSNFAWTFRSLPAEKRRGMEALYAFARKTDDLGDSAEPVEHKRKCLIRWRESLEAAFDNASSDPLLPALVDICRRYEIPRRYLSEIIDGVERDLSPVVYSTFAELRDYCYLVASAVGLACVHIWGFTSEDVFAPAIECGIAFQLTNILRDLREDAQTGRCYLPQEHLAACQVSRDDLLNGQNEAGLQELLDLEFHITSSAYELGAETARHLSSDGQRIFAMMFDTYRSLFDELQRRGIGILHERVRLGWHARLTLAARSLLYGFRADSRHQAGPSQRLSEPLTRPESRT